MRGAAGNNANPAGTDWLRANKCGTTEADHTIFAVPRRLFLHGKTPVKRRGSWASVIVASVALNSVARRPFGAVPHSLVVLVSSMTRWPMMSANSSYGRGQRAY